MKFFRLSALTCAGMAAGAVSLKNPHHIITLRFSEVVNDHANYAGLKFRLISAIMMVENQKSTR